MFKRGRKNCCMGTENHSARGSIVDVETIERAVAADHMNSELQQPRAGNRRKTDSQNCAKRLGYEEIMWTSILLAGKTIDARIDIAFDPIHAVWDLKFEIPEFKLCESKTTGHHALEKPCFYGGIMHVTKSKRRDLKGRKSKNKTKSKGSTSRFTPLTRIAPSTAPKTAPKTITPTTSAVGNTRERVDRCRLMLHVVVVGLGISAPVMSSESVGETLASYLMKLKLRLMIPNAEPNVDENSPIGVLTLVVVEENEIISEAPLQVQPLLKEFVNVIPDDISLLDYRLLRVDNSALP
ncbi:hypothetical protein Tco_0341051 [Tanacetum coccineum]